MKIDRQSKPTLQKSEYNFLKKQKNRFKFQIVQFYCPIFAYPYPLPSKL